MNDQSISTFTMAAVTIQESRCKFYTTKQMSQQQNCMVFSLARSAYEMANGVNFLCDLKVSLNFSYRTFVPNTSEYLQ